MAVKYFELEGIGTVRVNKRSGSRSLRLTIAGDGEVRVTIPAWTTYKSGVDFARSKGDWIRQHRPARSEPLGNGHQIGKAHRLVFETAAIDAPTARLAGTEIRILRPMGMAITHPKVQQAANRACIRALRSQAETLLPKRLRDMAAQHGFSYHSVSIRQLKGRWGSCDAHKNIVLNLFLMQLPWQVIDYVLMHELIHTKHLNHGPEFWNEFVQHEKHAKTLRKLTKRYKPVLLPLTSGGTPLGA